MGKGMVVGWSRNAASKRLKVVVAFLKDVCNSLLCLLFGAANHSSYRWSCLTNDAISRVKFATAMGKVSGPRNKLDYPFIIIRSERQREISLPSTLWPLPPKYTIPSKSGLSAHTFLDFAPNIWKTSLKIYVVPNCYLISVQAKWLIFSRSSSAVQWS